MLNKLGTTEDMVEYHDNGNIAYKFFIYSSEFITESTFDKNGRTLTVKYSNGHYRIKDKDATQEEYEAFIKELGKPKKQTNMLNKLGTTENMVIYHPNGNKSYEFKTDSDGLIEKTFDKNGNLLTFKNSNGYTSLFTRDEEGNELAYNTSGGCYLVKGKYVTQQEYEAFIQELEKKQTVVQELEKPKTAMQELIDYMKTYFYLTDESLEMFDQALEKEKQQTLLGVYEGQKNHSASDEENKIMAEHWFNETYNQTK